MESKQFNMSKEEKLELENLSLKHTIQQENLQNIANAYNMKVDEILERVGVKREEVKTFDAQSGLIVTKSDEDLKGEKEVEESKKKLKKVK